DSGSRTARLVFVGSDAVVPTGRSGDKIPKTPARRPGFRVAAAPGPSAVAGEPVGAFDHVRAAVVVLDAGHESFFKCILQAGLLQGVRGVRPQRFGELFLRLRGQA